VSILDYYAQACFAAAGTHYPPSAGGLLYAERRPHGVAGLITPWNFPLAIPLWKAAPALAAGNAVLLKPSPEATGCAALIGEILGDCLPAGVCTVLPGGAVTGSALVAAADVVSFTGSVQVGRQVALAATGRGVPVQCEMGGQNAAIILPDADPTAAAAMVAGAAMGYAGQKCTATRRIIVVGRLHGFVAALTAAVAGLIPADPAATGTVVGPLITDMARAKVLEAAGLAAADGARVLAGGTAPSADGWFVEPTLVDGLPPGHPLCQQETFGPLAVLLHAADLDEAIALANGVEFGLVSSVHGRSIGPLLTAIAGLDTGLIRVNAPTTGVDFYAPFGGEKASGLGQREQGMAALEFYGSTRTVTIASPD
jgi:aldehyde dehydrogenase (NAD+)